MLLKISFYILNNEATLKGRDLYTCRLIEKAYSNNHKIYIHTSDLKEAQNFDAQLWTFSDISFVPHEIYNQESEQNSPVIIGYEHPPKELNDIMVNLTPQIVPSYPQFNHLIEVVHNDELLKAKARERYQIYQKEGHQVQTFKV